MAEIPTILTVLPLRNTVVFPRVSIPLSVGREKTVAAVQEAANRENGLAILSQRDGLTDLPDQEDLFNVGVICRVTKVLPLGDGTLNVTVYGLERCRVIRFIRQSPFIEVEVERLVEPERDDREIGLPLIEFKRLLEQYIQLDENPPEEIRDVAGQIEAAGPLCDLAAYHLRFTMARKQEALETLDVRDRLAMLTRLVKEEIEVLLLSNKIRGEIKTRFDHSQRELILREQLKSIKQELGEPGEKDDEILELQKAIAKARLPEHAEKAARKELERLARSSPMSAEYGMLRTYMEWIIDMPWSQRTQDNLDIARAQRVLDEDHYDLEKIKKRIVEFLAVRKLKVDSKGPILCFAGPPGVGKTSLGKSIARALERKFTRISLGGVHDEAEIRGHRRTYVGAMPGRILQGLKKVKVANPVFMLDEIDKLGADFRGDPSSAMLEVLDPEQNHSFIDHYLGLPFDLSAVLFICTANRLDTVPPALRDRMEVVDIPGYTEEEKLHIAQQFIIPKEVAEHGLSSESIEFAPEALQLLINAYTREAGVRNLGREIAALCRRAARDVAVGVARKPLVTAEDVPRILGPIKFHRDIADDGQVPGVSTGLIWTPAGGDIVFIEVAQTKGKGELILTGLLGDVMKESAQTAFSFLKSHAADYPLVHKNFAERDYHIHVPAGAIPKDGPSAGITLLTAMLSLLAQVPVDSKLAMTGEITLRGSLMPVGGIKEKMLAAKRAGIQRVFLPEKNRKDVEDIPAQALASLQINYFTEMADVLKAVFGDFGGKAENRPTPLTVM